MTRSLQLLVVGLAALLGACRPSGVADADRDLALYSALLAASTVEIHVSEALRPEGARAARAIVERGDHDAVVVPFGTPSDEGRPRLLLGRVDEPAITVLLTDLGFEVTAEGFRFHGRDFEQPDDGLVAVIPDPDRIGLPATVVAANDVEALRRSWRLLVPGWEPGLRVVRRGEVELIGELSGRWPPQVFVDVDRLPVREAADERWSTVNRGAITMRAEQSQGAPKLVGEYLRAAEVAHLRALSWTGVPTDEVGVVATVYTSSATMLDLLGRVDLGRLSPIGEGVHALVTRDYPGDGGRAVAEAAALAALGEPAEPWMLDGVGLYASRRYWSWDLDSWIAWLHAASFGATVLELTASDFDVPTVFASVPDTEAIAERAAVLSAIATEAEEAGEDVEAAVAAAELGPPPTIDVAVEVPRSPHRTVPQRGLLFRFLLETRGADELLALWRGDAQLEITEELELAYARYLDATLEAQRESLEAGRTARVERARTKRDVHGVRVLPPQGLDGLVGADGLDAVDDLRRAGANTVLVPVYGFLNRPRPSQPFAALAGPGAWPDGAAADRRDVELFLFGQRARTAGLSLALAPDLLESAYGGLAAHDQNLVALHDWVEFLARYGGFLEHYALVSELAGAQILNLGTELGPATETRADARDTVHPDPETAELILDRLDPLRRADRLHSVEDALVENRLSGARAILWAEALARVRRSYSGLLTYTPANNGERDRIVFWPKLDLVGASWFQPLAALPPKPGEEVPPELKDERLENDQGPERDILEKSLTSQIGVHATWARRGRRPLLVMGAGFPGTDLSWKNPEVRRGDSDPEVRTRYLRGLAVALERARREHDNFSGAILWSWAIDPADEGRLSRGHLVSAPGARGLLPIVFGDGDE